MFSSSSSTESVSPPWVLFSVSDDPPLISSKDDCKINYAICYLYREQTYKNCDNEVSETVVKELYTRERLHIKHRVSMRVWKMYMRVYTSSIKRTEHTTEQVHTSPHMLLGWLLFKHSIARNHFWINLDIWIIITGNYYYLNVLKTIGHYHS